MKRTLLVLGCTFCSIAMMAQTAVKATGSVIQAADAPSVTVKAPVVEAVIAVGETEHNFGKIPQGKPVTYDFTVTNKGTVGFKLDHVQASCGCTTPEWNKDEVIAPGATSIIKVGYNAAASGPFNKTITITYNGTQSTQIFIKGEVWNTPAASAPTNDNLKDLN